MDNVRVTWNGGKITEAAIAGALRGLAISAELILQRSRQVVPNDEGTLERSGVASVDRRTMTAAVSYDTPYAVRQHEVPMNHQDGRTDKYLERPWRSSRKDVSRILQTQIKKAMGT
jgi:hypothetical protein